MTLLHAIASVLGAFVVGYGLGYLRGWPIGRDAGRASIYVPPREEK
jgi:ABC-type cobalt transport system substrate-binding protein